MSWIRPFEANMNLSAAVLNWQPKSIWIQTAKKIAVCLIIPFGMITFFEAVVKNLIFVNLANACVTILNLSYATFFKAKP